MVKKNLTIREMTIDDLLRVHQIEKACFTDPWPYSIFLNDLEADHTLTYVAANGKKVVGFIICMTILDEMHLTNIAIDPEFQRKKVGHALLEHIFCYGERFGSSVMYLDVRKSNEAAINFYRGFGFDVLYERRGYYRNPPEDALVMSLNLNERSKSGVV